MPARGAAHLGLSPADLVRPYRAGQQPLPRRTLHADKRQELLRDRLDPSGKPVLSGALQPAALPAPRGGGRPGALDGTGRRDDPSQRPVYVQGLFRLPQLSVRHRCPDPLLDLSYRPAVAVTPRGGAGRLGPRRRAASRPPVGYDQVGYPAAAGPVARHRGHRRGRGLLAAAPFPRRGCGGGVGGLGQVQRRCGRAPRHPVRPPARLA